MIDNLIKSILEQIGVLVERQAPEELMKTLPNGQWELLRKTTKTPENPHTQANAMTSRLFHHANVVHEALQPHIDKHLADFRSTPIPPGQSKSASLKHLHEYPVEVPVHPALQVWGDQVEEKTGKGPDFRTIKGIRGALKQHLLDLPQGQIDLGHLNKLREGSKKVPEHISDYRRDPDPLVMPLNDEPTENTHASRVLSTGDMEEIINHHVGDAKSLKEIHDKNGGIGAVEALGRTLGTSGAPSSYTGIKLHPQVYTDALELMRPGSRDYSINDPDEPLESTYPNHLQYPNAAEHEEAVDSTFRRMADGSESNMKDHENAVINRALDRFKHHHKL